MKKNANASRGPGRPIANIVIPRGKFTFDELKDANKVTPLTLRKFLKRDSKLGKKSQVILTDETRNPNSKNGLGRKVFVYQRRAGVAVSVKTIKQNSKTHVAVKIKSKPSDTGTADYEAQKAALLAPAAETAPAPAPAPAPAEADPVPAVAPTVAADTAETVAA